jgi:hypothetical protein
LAAARLNQTMLSNTSPRSMPIQVVTAIRTTVPREAEQEQPSGCTDGELLAAMGFPLFRRELHALLALSASDRACHSRGAHNRRREPLAPLARSRREEDTGGVGARRGRSDESAAQGVAGMTDFQGSVRVLNTAGEGPRIILDGDQTDVLIGGTDSSGKLVISDSEGRQAITVEPLPGGARVRLRGEDGIVAELVSALGASVLSLGGSGADGSVSVKNAAGQIAVFLSGRDGDIVIEGADAAENFTLAPDCTSAPAGTVMVLTDDESVRPCDRPYDRRVAGVVSGGSQRRTGILLGHAPGSAGVPIALAGTVMCNVDATDIRIHPGDLLTTSARPGYAMPALDPHLSFGAVVGKALRGVEHGQAQIPILVVAC